MPLDTKNTPRHAPNPPAVLSPHSLAGAEGAKLVHDFRNAVLAMQFGLAALDGAWRGKDEEQFNSTRAAMLRELESLKALVAQTAGVLERGSVQAD